jgi:hypothetical protein
MLRNVDPQPRPSGLAQSGVYTEKAHVDEFPCRKASFLRKTGRRQIADKIIDFDVCCLRHLSDCMAEPKRINMQFT